MERFLRTFDIPSGIPIEEAIYGRYGEMANYPAILMKQFDLAQLLLDKDKDDAAEEKSALRGIAYQNQS